MITNIRSKSGQSLVEFTTLIIIVTTAFLVFQQYIARGLYGRWKQTGDSMGQSKIYDNNASVQCGNDVFTNRPTVWYEETCFAANCFDKCIKFRDTAAWKQSACRTCINNTCPCPF